MNTNTFIQRKPFDFHDPWAHDFSIKEIAHLLANLSFFSGRTREFYSVAQHCVLASYEVFPEYALQALMHGSAKAYLGVLPRSLQLLLPDYIGFEQEVEKAIFTRFGLSAELAPQVLRINRALRATEHRDLFEKHEELSENLLGARPLKKKISSWFPSEANRYFLCRFKELYKPGRSDIEDFATVSKY